MAQDLEELWHLVLSGRMRTWARKVLRGTLFRCRACALESHIAHKVGSAHPGEALGPAAVDRCAPYSPDEHPFAAWLVKRVSCSRASTVGGPRLIAKSVHAPLCIDWITHRFAVDVLVVLRNPYSIFASQMRMAMPDRARNLTTQSTIRRDYRSFAQRAGLGQSHLDRAAFQLALMTKILSVQVENHPEYHVLSHDRLCTDPQSGFRATLQELGIPWSRRVANAIEGFEAHGGAYSTERLARNQPSRWRQELSEEQIETVQRWTADFGLEPFMAEQVLA
jgi:hypothetical protein